MFKKVTTIVTTTQEDNETYPFVYKPYTEEEHEELLNYCRINKLTIKEYQDKLVGIREEKDNDKKD